MSYRTITRRDDERLEEGGHKGVRLILPSNKRQTYGCVDKVWDAGRKVRLFQIRHGDTSAEERRVYAGRLQNSPSRAMAVHEGRDDRKPANALFEASFTLVLAPGPRVTSDWCILAQFNAMPGVGDRGKSPPFAIGIRTVGGAEHLYAEPSTLPHPSATENGRHIQAGSLPLTRAAHRVVMQCVDGKGKSGLMRVLLDDQVLCDYQGPTGYSNHWGCFFSYGIYRSPWCPGRESLSVSFENVRQGLAAAPAAR